MRFLRHPALLVVALALGLPAAGCASGGAAHTPRTTATDESADRILVTVRTHRPADVRLSPSGRLDYLPSAEAEVRAEQLGRAGEIVDDLGGEFSMRLEEDWPIPALGVHCFVFRLADAGRREAALAALTQHPDVESAQPLNFFHARSDPLSEPDGAMLSGTSRLRRQADGSGVRIAVIDTGADLTHEDLSNARIRALDLVTDGTSVPAERHGTAVLGLIVAARGNGKGIGGLAPAADILLLRACWQPETREERAVCNTFTLAKALSQALESEAGIVNLSIEGPRDPLLERLGELLVQRGRLVVAAGTTRQHFPASVRGSVMAASLLPDAGDHVMTLLPGNRYALRSGSSIDAARVSAIAALVRDLAPDLDLERLRRGLARLRGETVDVVFADLLSDPAALSRPASHP